MAQNDTSSAMGIFGALHNVADHIDSGDWHSAEQRSVDLEEIGRRVQMSKGSSESEWHTFLNAVDHLRIAVRAHDKSGCHEAISDIKASLLHLIDVE